MQSRSGYRTWCLVLGILVAVIVGCAGQEDANRPGMKSGTSSKRAATGADIVVADPSEHAVVKVKDQEVERAEMQMNDENGLGYKVLQERSDRLLVELPNGMIVIAQQVPTAPVVSVQTWIKTGSIYEQEHVGAGLSHFLEHLLSGGSTSTRPEIESTAILGSMGAQTNAATSLDTVRYYINTTSDHTATAVDLLSDWMQNSSITQEEYARERDVIQREFDMGKGEPGRIFWKLTQKARFEDHPAKHPTIGYLDEFLKISRDEIYDFYKRMYVPNNMLFVVVGDIDSQKIVDQVAALWKDQKAGKLPELKFPVEQEITEPRFAEGTADIKRTKVRLIWPGTQLAAPGDFELDLLAIILGQGEASRLIQTVRDQDRLVTSIDAYNSSFNWGPGFFGVDAEIASDQYTVDQVKQAILDQVTLLRDQPVTDEELARAKRIVLSNVVQANQTAQGIASTLARDITGSSDPDYLPKYANAIQNMTVADLQKTAKRIMLDQRLITVLLKPAPKDAEKEEPAVEMVELEEKEGLVYEPIDLDNRVVVKEMIENIAKNKGHVTPIEVDEATAFTLENGLRVIVQRSTVVPAVSMNLYWKGGLLSEQAGHEGVANAAAMMLNRGTSKMTALEISQTVESLGASLGAASGSNTSYVNSSALRDDWPKVMTLLSEIVLEPSFPEQEWLKLQPRVLAAIDRQTDTWYGELRHDFRQTYFGDYPWAVSTYGRRDIVEKLTAEQLKDFYTKHLGATDAVLAVVGDVDPDQVKAKAEELFGKMPSKPIMAFDPAMPKEPESQIKQFETQKPLAAVQIGFGPGMVRSNPDYPAMMVLTKVMSDFPSGWLEQELRGKGPGLVYAVGAGNLTGLVPGYFAIQFNTSPQQATEAISRAMSVVERAKAGDFTEADIERAKQKVLTNEFFAKQSNSSLATDAALDDLYGLNDPGSRKFLKAVQNMTAEELKVVANKYLNNPVTVILTNQIIPLGEDSPANAEPTAQSTVE
ncbi:M16 family metallopeptidase [Poriferisphaera sp. WC338]|uniref:M16 family metallopeptidase n=1 Tax=Poriferisphaera sp. WC338 TaxID=3425129 RepID=UPI003D814A1E